MNLFKKMSAFALLVALCIAQSTDAQNALNYDGVDDYVQTTYPGVLGTADRTFEAWVYVPNSVSTNMAILDYGINAVGSRNTFNVGSGNKLSFISGGTNANISSANNSVPIGQWTHVAFVLSSGTGYLYVDGNQVGTGNLTTVNTPAGTASLTIGERVSGGSIPFQGTIDEVRVWNYARTQAEIQADMNGELCALPSGIEAYYKVNEGIAGGSNSGLTTLADESAGSYNGTLLNFSLNGSTSNFVSGSGIGTGSNSASSFSVDGCNQYIAPSGQVCDSTGIYTDVIANAAGCDSVMTIDVNITDINVNVTDNGDNTLTADQAGATYQWLNCNQGFAYISGATSQTFAPTQNGQFAVEVTLNGCVDSSSCYNITTVGLPDVADEQITVYPNPAVGRITLEAPSPVTFEVFDIQGRRVYLEESPMHRSQIDVRDWARGTYVVRIRTDRGVRSERIVLQ